MVKGTFRGFYRYLISVIKRIDKIINYKIGNVIREITNINTKRYWDKKLAQYGESWRDFCCEHIVEFLPKDRHFSLLDIGCALGDGCVFLKRHFPQGEINGADYSEFGIEKAKKRADNINFFILDISKENLPRKYDYITLIHTLEHFNDPFPIVDKCLKFVNEALIIQVPYVEKFVSPHLYWRGQHRCLFNEKTFSRYKCTILKISEPTDYYPDKDIIYKLIP